MVKRSVGYLLVALGFLIVAFTLLSILGYMIAEENDPGSLFLRLVVLGGAALASCGAGFYLLSNSRQ